MNADERFVGALDQGTTSTRFILFDHEGTERGVSRIEHRQYYPKPGWVEHDPVEIRDRAYRVIGEGIKAAGIDRSQLLAIGITNQRETTVVWDRDSGVPLYNAVVWQDTRTASIVDELAASKGMDRYRDQTGLPLATYFSGPKIRWLLRNVEDVRKAVKAGRAVFGTIDSWLIWNLTGGTGGGALVTDVTNASRTLMMNIETLEWEQEILDDFGVAKETLPEIVPSIPDQPYGTTDPDGPLGIRVPIAGALGDQQAALFGQACFSEGDSKNTYGTGCFLLQNTGHKIVRSRYGLLTTVAYLKHGDTPCYALEGSIAIAGALVQWIRDNLGLIDRSEEIEALASQVDDSGGVYFVPAFSGLFAPHWKPDARGIIAGLTGYATAGHLARAVLESTAFQTQEIVEAMEKESGAEIDMLKVDGGMVVNAMLMQFQSDILDIPVVRPQVAETTALGAAYAAGLSVGFWDSRDELAAHWREEKRWNPTMERNERERRLRLWRKAVERSFGWAE